MKQRTTLTGILPVLTAILALTLTALPAAGGIYYKAVNEVSESGHQESWIVEGRIDGDNARIDFTNHTNPLIREGAYLVTTDGGQIVYLVNPDDETYSEWDLAAMAAMAGQMMESMGGMVKFEISDPQVEKLLEESGPSMQGLATTHYRYRTTYTVETKVLGMRRGSDNEIVQDIWTTDQLSDVALGVWLRSEPPKTGQEGIDNLIEAEMEKVSGFPLKTVAVTTTTDTRRDETTTTRSTTEVTELERGQSFDAAIFQVPEGYTKTEMMTAGEDEEGGNPFKKLFGRDDG